MTRSPKWPARRPTDRLPKTGRWANSKLTLLAADAAARHEMIEVHRDLQAERQQLGTGWDDLEVERQRIARQRRTESLVVALASAVAGVVLVSVLLGFLWVLLATSPPGDADDAQFYELLVEQLLAGELEPDKLARPETDFSNRLAGPDATPQANSTPID